MRPNSLNLLYEDKHLLVCVKPSGTATQSRSVKHPDMESLLKNHIAKNCSSTPSSGKPYLAVIHRLDQPVQGIMVFAKTPFAAGELSKELQSGGFGKYYRALVCGAPPHPAGTLEHYIQKESAANTSRICQKEAAGAKYACLTYQTVPEEERYFPLSPDEQQGSSFTELDIYLQTGRHHQIRVQLAGIGCPIAGDTKYNPALAPASGYQELKLCSYRLSFTHPKTKKAMQFTLI